ncbi:MULTISPECIES: IS4-like element ISSysp2 family transposase [Cyanophyceae]|uniref:IS4-like element ISSysp2 family transposase n=1 Tax=Cyanophyceae TaxID=3028117 RepID=UPI00016DC3B2|nr:MULTISPECIES: IS4-like element ISSysp2 family transposase [Cyanophyceae]ACB01072.1 Transposase (IS4 family) [Picosynechococcus sp. PCC 7002]SMH47681.1 Transposase DDE domain-containing protein [Picosynechococcus sp. OG1]SMQ81067.1 Transposase DDE domain-containing protein [Synechococcus sp. 7002]
MNQISEIRRQLRPHLGWHGARLSFIALFLVALFRAKTVNLAELATVWGGNAAEESNYKRMQRFFQSFDVNMDKIARMVMNIAAIPQPWVLSIDRTNWSLGTTDFNILMLCVVHEGIGYPLMWTMLKKKRGNSNSTERMDLLERFETLFPNIEIAYLTGDREFIGKPWLSYLMLDKPIPFRLRLRQTDKISKGKGQPAIAGSHLFRSLAIGETRILSGKRWVWGRQVYVMGTRLDPKRRAHKNEDEFLIIITTHDPQNALADYRRRWGIETLFGALKTRGFCLESTHFTDKVRLSKLLALLAIGFVWAMKAGLWRHTQKPIRIIKAHGRRARSLFRYDFDLLRRFFTASPQSLLGSEFHPIQLLSCT